MGYSPTEPTTSPDSLSVIIQRGLCNSLEVANNAVAINLCDEEYNQKYMNFGIALKKSEWHKHYATQAMKAFLTSIFESQQYRCLKGIVMCINPNNQNAINWVQNPLTQQVKKPFVYRGEINFPKGFCTILPKPCVAHCYTVSKEDFQI